MEGHGKVMLMSICCVCTLCSVAQCCIFSITASKSLLVAWEFNVSQLTFGFMSLLDVRNDEFLAVIAFLCCNHSIHCPDPETGQTGQC